MVFRHDFSDELEDTLAKLYKKDRKIYEIIFKKIDEIVSMDEAAIGHYKNLRHEMKEYKRVHIAKSFVLLFIVYKKEKFILFDRFDHHDNVYKR